MSFILHNLLLRDGVASAGTVSGAALLAAGYAQAFALDFTDDSFLASEGFYGSAFIKDTGTPANNYNSSPTKTASSLLTYTAPSLKMTMGPSGTLRFQAHNLYLNSASPANQSITVVSGATYAVTITGSVSVTASGAATGTWTAGTNTFTAATTTLTLGSTSGSGTVHVRRTPSDSTYLATTSASRVSLPLEWDSAGNALGLLVEEARTNLLTYSDDLTNAVWSKTNATATKTATGPDGVANSASTLTATANNGVAYQNITSASAARSGQVWLKRRTGTGAVSVAIGETTGGDLVTNGDFSAGTDWSLGAGWTISGGVLNGATGAFAATSQNLAGATAGKFYRVTVDVTVSAGFIAIYISSGANYQIGSSGSFSFIVDATGGTSLSIGGFSFTGTVDNITATEVTESTIDLSGGGWVRATIENKTLTNPCLAIKLATSGDAVDVALAGVESGAFVTSPIPTIGSTVTRAADNISKATSGLPFSATAGAMYARWTPKTVSGTYHVMSLTDGTVNESVLVRNINANPTFTILGGLATQCDIDAGTATAAQQKFAVAWAANDFAASFEGGAAVTDGAGTLPTVTTLRIGGVAGAGSELANGHIKQILYVPERIADAALQTLTGA